MGLPARAINIELWHVAGLASPPVGHTSLVRRANHHPRSWGYKDIGVDDLHVFWNPSSPMWGPQEPGFHCALVPKCLRRGMFLSNNSYQDVWLKLWLLTLAYAWVLQYWAEEANPLAHGEPHPLVKCVRELRQHVRRYTTFSESVIFEGLGNVIHEAKYRDMVTLLVDSTTSSVMADVEDAQLSPVETPPVDDTKVWATEPNAEIQKDLPTTQCLWNWKLLLLPLWYWWISWPPLPLGIAMR